MLSPIFISVFLTWHLTCTVRKREPITRSFHLPYLPSESTPSRIFLFLEAPPTEVFAGVFIIANHERAGVLYCHMLSHMLPRESISILAESEESNRTKVLISMRQPPQNTARLPKADQRHHAKHLTELSGNSCVIRIIASSCKQL